MYKKIYIILILTNACLPGPTRCGTRRTCGRTREDAGFEQRPNDGMEVDEVWDLGPYRSSFVCEGSGANITLGPTNIPIMIHSLVCEGGGVNITLGPTNIPTMIHFMNQEGLTPRVCVLVFDIDPETSNKLRYAMSRVGPALVIADILDQYLREFSQSFSIVTPYTEEVGFKFRMDTHSLEIKVNVHQPPEARASQVTVPTRKRRLDSSAVTAEA